MPPAKRVQLIATSLQGMGSAVEKLAHSVREAARIAASSGMLSDIAMANAASVDQLMDALKGTLADIGAGMGLDASQLLSAGETAAVTQRRVS